MKEATNLAHTFLTDQNRSSLLNIDTNLVNKTMSYEFKSSFL